MKALLLLREYFFCFLAQNGYFSFVCFTLHCSNHVVLISFSFFLPPSPRTLHSFAENSDLANPSFLRLHELLFYPTHFRSCFFCPDSFFLENLFLLFAEIDALTISSIPLLKHNLFFRYLDFPFFPRIP